MMSFNKKCLTFHIITILFLGEFLYYVKSTSESLPNLNTSKFRKGFKSIGKNIDRYYRMNISNLKINSKCLNSIENVIEAFKAEEIWALKMIDASAKLPSGILGGNLNQYGDYDECLSVKKAKYCLVEFDLTNFWGYENIELENLVHSYFAFRGNTTDPAHRVPDFSQIKWGFCIPSQCSEKDLELLLNSNELSVKANIKNSMCKAAISKTKKLYIGDLFARSFFVLLIFVVLLASYLESKEKLNVNTKSSLWLKIVDCFCFQKNLKNLTKTKDKRSNPNDIIEGLDGIRTLNALALFMFHKSGAMLYNPYINKTSAAQGLGKAWSVIGRTAIIYTDSFMLISGLLNSKAILEELESTKKINIGRRISNRIFRMLPNLLAIILFATYILPYIGSGPLWPLVVEHHSTLCKKYMWRNLLFIHNYYGFENMCLTHTHQVGIDFQLYLITPFLIYLIKRNYLKGLITVSAIIVGSTFLRFWVTIRNNLSHVVYFGIPIKKMFDTASLSYILPTHRATIYFMGFLLAFYLKNLEEKVLKIAKWQRFILWILAFSFGLTAMIGPYRMARINYEYNIMDAAIFAAFSPIAWGFLIVWGIIVSDIGYGGWLGNFMSWKGFQIFTKISYAVYLVQFPVFFYFVGIQRTSDEYKFYHMIHLSETFIVLLSSTLLTLMVEMPFQKIAHLIFEKEKTNKRNIIKDEETKRKSKAG